MASAFDEPRTAHSLQVVPGTAPNDENDNGGNARDAAQRTDGHTAQTGDGTQLSDDRARGRFREFIRNFRLQGSPVFLYRDQLLQRSQKQEYRLDVDLEHLNSYDENLSDLLLKYPDEYLPLFEGGAQDALRGVVQFGMSETEQLDLPDLQVTLTSNQTPTPMREMLANDVNRLLLVPGIVISASKVTSVPKLTVYMCKSCKEVKSKRAKAGVSRVNIERACAKCGNFDQMVVIPEKCEFVDRQFLKLQEAPECVPTGEMPRHVALHVERFLVDQVAPGARVAVMGVSSLFRMDSGGGSKKGGAAAQAARRKAYLRVVGIQNIGEGVGRGGTHFTPEEERQFVDMSRDPMIYDKIVGSLAPSISGEYTKDIKKAIACLLFGGTRRSLPDGMRLRGDINVLMLGDPSTAKSQFLKFAEKVAPVGVYTSGKGSSAAGLTASVVKDAKGEFYLEGGAMVLADGGVVCIDEFDKMREQDRVAIHEAMEQQTISIAKAGITTILNSRTSVLAAANPVFGTYDDNRSAAENIDFLPTILSRFDLIFIVRDVRDEEKDRAIARHVMGVHVNFGATVDSSNGQRQLNDGEIDLVTMRKYIAFCRARCAPVLSAATAEILRDHYVGIRDAHRRQNDGHGSARNATVPITVRQLEAIVRVSESLAKMQLAAQVTPDHVAEATRLFKVSTLSAAASGAMPGDMSSLNNEQLREVQHVEEQLKRRVPIGSRVVKKTLIDELVQRQGFSSLAVNKAISVLEARNEVEHVSQQRMIRRVR